MLMLAATFFLCLAQAAPAAAPISRPAPSGPVVALDTTLGQIRIALREDKAPVSVKNFLSYVRSGHYDGTVFHRVIPGFMVQGGGMTADMKEKPSQAPIRNESKNGLRNTRGTLAMARTDDPNSATAQFFINVKDNASLDFGVRDAGYAVFGEVIGGMDVVDRIVAVPTSRDVPLTPVVIRSARVEGGTAMPAATASPTASPATRPPRPMSPMPKATPEGR